MAQERPPGPFFVGSIGFTLNRRLEYELGRAVITFPSNVRAAAKTRVTEDALFGGRLALFQPAPGFGYRANIDALLLAAFAGRHRVGVARAVDLGSGVGAVGLSLLHLGIALRVAFVERDASLATLCRRNLEANGLDRRGSVFVGDLERSLHTIAPDLLHGANLVVANPPYVTHERDGRVTHPRNHARRAARHGDLAPFVRAAADALGRRGRACFVYPAHALLDLVIFGRDAGLEPKRLRFVHGRADRPARIALVELAPAKPGGLVVETPLIETGPNGRPSEEVAQLVRS